MSRAHLTIKCALREDGSLSTNVDVDARTVELVVMLACVMLELSGPCNGISATWLARQVAWMAADIERARREKQETLQ
ncbi:MAG: hypothetical protein LBS89_09025 [Zoogloeaceae bacterium]|jgi:hypothetical protein|nr:hypothetical protein [Zoogloeaceae bacterium]